MRRVPLSRTFMLASILGFLIITVYTASGKIPLTWGFTFDFVLALMFIASVLSITPDTYMLNASNVKESPKPAGTGKGSKPTSSSTAKRKKKQ